MKTIFTFLILLLVAEPVFAAKKKALSLKARKAQAHTLLASARKYYADRNYTQAIKAAEKVRKIEIPGETAYLSEAKIILDKARLSLNENFEPFMRAARKNLSEKKYAAARDLCAQMLKRDSQYQPAKDLLMEINRFDPTRELSSDGGLRKKR